jgi:hypothetical protein
VSYFTKRHVTVRAEDLVGVGIELGPGPGDSNIGETNSENTETNAVLDRGSFDCATSGDDMQQDFSITVNVQRATVLPDVEDFIMKTGAFATLQTFNGDDQKWLCKLIVTETLGGSTRTQTCLLVKLRKAWAEGTENNVITVTGTIYGGVTRTRS